MFENFTPEPPRRVATWFVNNIDRDSGELLTQLKLQKLVYYAEAWFLANFDMPLTGEDFEAWAHGPAMRSLYAKYGRFGWEALPPEVGPNVKSDLAVFLKAVHAEYGQFSARKLENMTHEEDPWLHARGGLPPEAASRNIIPKLEIRNFYAKRIGRSAIKKLQDQPAPKRK